MLLRGILLLWLGPFDLESIYTPKVDLFVIGYVIL